MKGREIKIVIEERGIRRKEKKLLSSRERQKKKGM